MNKKSVIYGFVSLIAGSAIAILPLNYSSKAQTQEPRQTAPAQTTPVNSPQAGRTTQVDKPFIELMIPHHQMAVDKADLALERAKNPEIKKLAASFKRDRPREIQQMRTWYKQWYGTEVPAASSAGMSMDDSMHNRRGRSQGMTGDEMSMMTMDLEALKNARDFDKEFILRMIPYNEMAVMMSKMVVNSAEHPEIRNLAQRIITDRTTENQQLKQMYQTRYK